MAKDTPTPPARSPERTLLLPTPEEIIVESSWLYPIRGLLFFSNHRFLWPLIKARLLPCVIISAIIFPILFIFTYLPQVAFLYIFQGQLAWFNATILVLGEGAAMVSLVFEAFFVDETLVEVFDAIFVKEGFTDLVRTRREIIEEGTDPLKQLGKTTKSAEYSPFSFRLTLEYILLLPLTFIPVFGTPLFLVINGRRAGPFHHHRYFKMLKLKEEERDVFVKHKRWRYTWFGTVALGLQLVPVLSMFFLITTAAGAAMWAVDLEKERRKREEAARAVPAYVDV